MGLTPTPVAERPSLTRDDIEVLMLLAEGLPLSTAVVWAARRGLV